MAWWPKFTREPETPKLEVADLDLADVDSVVAALGITGARAEWDEFGAIALGGIYAELVRLNRRTP